MNSEALRNAAKNDYSELKDAAEELQHNWTK